MLLCINIHMIFDLNQINTIVFQKIVIFMNPDINYAKMIYTNTICKTNISLSDKNNSGIVLSFMYHSCSLTHMIIRYLLTSHANIL